MAEAWQRQSPLARRSPMDDDTGAGLAMSEREFLAKITVRGARSRMTPFATLWVSPCQASPTPHAPARITPFCGWGPDEWLVVGPPDTERELVSTLGAALPDAAVIDVTEGYATIRLGGPLARDVLSMGTPLDLHPREFAAGAATRTLFARTHHHPSQDQR